MARLFALYDIRWSATINEIGINFCTADVAINSVNAFVHLRLLARTDVLLILWNSPIVMCFGFDFPRKEEIVEEKEKLF